MRNNRITLALAYIVSLVGCVLLSDWQATGGHTCSPLHINITSDYESDYPSTYYGVDEGPLYNSSANMTPLDFQFFLESCEAQSSSSHQCFWNPQSRITGDYCNTCLPVCLSYQASLNLYQFSAGVLMLSVGSFLAYFRTNAIVSDITPVNSQVYNFSHSHDCGTCCIKVAGTPI